MNHTRSRTLGDAFASRKPDRVAARQHARLTEIVSFAPRSPYYGEFYRGLPETLVRRVQPIPRPRAARAIGAGKYCPVIPLG